MQAPSSRALGAESRGTAPGFREAGGGTKLPGYTETEEEDDEPAAKKELRGNALVGTRRRVVRRGDAAVPMRADTPSLDPVGHLQESKPSGFDNRDESGSRHILEPKWLRTTKMPLPLEHQP